MRRPLAALVLLCLLSCDDGGGQAASPLMEFEASDSATASPNNCDDAAADAARDECISPGTVVVRSAEAPVRPATRSESYQYEAACDPGERPQWSFITYIAHTPGYGAVHFQARVADTEAELGAADWTDAALAQSSPTDTQSCSYSDPGCPVSLHDALGGPPTVNARWIEFELRYYDSTSGDPVSIERWGVDLSCETI